MRGRSGDHNFSNFYNAPGARDTVVSFRGRPSLRSSMAEHADIVEMQAELRHLKFENASLKQELKWHTETATKSEAKARKLLMELGTLKRFAERTELMNPQLSLILVGMICRLVDEISKDPQRTGKALDNS